MSILNKQYICSLNQILDNCVFVCQPTRGIPLGDFKVSGVYAILNTYNSKIYVGQAVDLRNRYENHFYRLKAGTSKNKHLQSAWDLYGEINFRFYILEVCEIEHLNQKEQTLLDTFFGEFSYNMCPIANSSLGFKHEESTIQNLRTIATSEESRERKSKIATTMWKNTEHRNHISKLASSQWENEEYKNYMFTKRDEYLNYEKGKKALSNKSISQWQNEDYRAKFDKTISDKRASRLAHLSEKERNKEETRLAKRKIANDKYLSKKKAEREALLSNNPAI